MTTIKNKRLAGNDRTIIERFARKQVERTADTAALDVAYENAANAVHVAVLAKYPQKDMTVLKRYGFANLDACIFVSTGGGDYDRFEFRADDKRIELRPKHNCRNHPLMLDGDAADSFKVYLAANKDHDAACKRRNNDFAALIGGARTFNELAAAWPAVEELREKIVGASTAITVLSDDVVARIQADPAFVVEPA